MHEDVVLNIVANAFNGMGDCDGSDDFGYSFAWIDLLDFMENYVDGAHERDTDELSAEFMAYTGTRYAMAYIDADGSQSVVGYTTKEDVKLAYVTLVADYIEFEERLEEEV